MSRFQRAVQQMGGVDVLIVDTASMAFALRSENDNAEVANLVMKPLVKLARALNCLIVLVHHVGKAKAEEGATREHAHRGRGASAWADFSVSIFNLDADASDQTRVTLTCGKRKNGGRYERLLKLDTETRWLRATGEQAAKPVTNDDLVLEAMQALRRRMMATADIEKSLVGRVKHTTVMNCLKRLADSGRVSSPRRGWWSLVSDVCPSCHAALVGVTTCTNCVEDDKSLPN